MAKKPPTKDIQNLAKELNVILKPEPKIRYVGVKANEIVSSIKKAAKLLEKGDKISKASAATMEALGIAHDATKGNGKKAPKKTGEKRVTNVDLMKSLLKKKASDKEIEKAFVKQYADKGMPIEWVRKRAEIYKRVETRDAKK